MRTQLESVEIDVAKGIYRINGTDISETCTELCLHFKNGEWSLRVVEDKTYTHSDQRTTV